MARDGQVIGEFDEMEFSRRVRSLEIRGSDHYFIEGMTDWKPVYEYGAREVPPTRKPASTIKIQPIPGKPFWPKLPTSSPAKMGGLLAFAAWIVPLVHPTLFFLLSLPFLVAAFILAIISIVKGRLVGGIILMIALLPAFIGSCGSMVDSDKILHHPEQLQRGR